MRAHDEFLELGASAIDFELSAGEAARLDAHLATCRECREGVAALERDAVRLRRHAWSDAPARIGEVIVHVAAGERPAPKRRSLPLVAGAAVLVPVLAVGVLVGGSILDQRQRDGSTAGPPPSATQSATAAAPSLSPTAAGDSAAPAFEWSLSSIPGTVGGARMLDVVASGNTVVAVGSDGGESGVGAVWTSRDGFDWTEQLLTPAAPLERVAAVGAGFVAISDTEVWHSTDGSAWVRAARAPAGARLVDVAAVPGGIDGAGTGSEIVAIGHLVSAPTDATVWVSPDGSSWTSLADSPALHSFCPTALAAGLDYVVAVGTDCGSPVARAVGVSTRRGLEWTRAPAQRAFGDEATPVALVAGTAEFVAAGSWRQGDLAGQAVWTSPDGLTWRRRATFRPPEFSERVAGLSAYSGGFLAAVVRDPNRFNAAAAWISPDAEHWMRTEPLPASGHEAATGQSIEATAAAGDRLVVVGWWAGESRGGDALVWSAPLAPR